MAKKFFYICAGILMLAISYHLGARSAGAQAGAGPPSAAMAVYGPYMYVMTPSGECFNRRLESNGICSSGFVASEPACDMGNLWEGAVSAAPQSWGQVKDRYRK